MSASTRREDFRSCGHGRDGSSPQPDTCEICAELRTLGVTSRALDRRINRLYRVRDREKVFADLRSLQSLHADVIQRIREIVFPPIPPVDTSAVDALLAKYEHLLGMEKGSAGA
jgi:hypothetical protein